MSRRLVVVVGVLCAVLSALGALVLPSVMDLSMLRSLATSLELAPTATLTVTDMAPTVVPTTMGGRLTIKGTGLSMAGTTVTLATGGAGETCVNKFAADDGSWLICEVPTKMSPAGPFTISVSDGTTTATPPQTVTYVTPRPVDFVSVDSHVLEPFEPFNLTAVVQTAGGTETINTDTVLGPGMAGLGSAPYDCTLITRTVESAPPTFQGPIAVISWTFGRQFAPNVTSNQVIKYQVYQNLPNNCDSYTKDTIGSQGVTPIEWTLTIGAAAATPTISGVSPSSGVAGDTLTISGTNLSGATVTVGGRPCVVASTSATSVTCLVPSGSAGSAEVVVTTSGGTATGTFSYDSTTAAPTVSGVSPSSGEAGDSITIAGTNMLGATVTVGGSACVVTANTATSVTCTVPAGSAGAADVVVTTGTGTDTEADGFTYLLLPTVSGVSPSSGVAGDTLTISGTNLSGATVTIGGEPCVVTATTASSITCLVPSGTAGAADVIVTNDDGSATAVGGFSYTATTPAPVIGGVSPTSGKAGDSITITGTDLVGATVTIGGNDCVVTANTATSLTCTVPAGTAGAADVVVTTGTGSDTEAGGFTYTASSPTIAGVSPSSGSAGDSITITGDNMTGASVTVGGNTCAITASSATSITCTVPAGTGTVDVVVTTDAGSVTSSGGFSYSAPPASDPVISGVSPSSGAAGSSITITGSNLSGASVTVGGSACVITANSATSITCTVPSGSGTVDVVVTTDAGTTTSSNAFTYSSTPPPPGPTDPEPVISGVSPSSGVAGDSIRITGTGLSGATVTIGGKPCVITANTATSITCTVPAGTPGTANVVVTTAGGSDTLPGGFTYAESPVAPVVSGVSPSSGVAGDSIRITGTNLLGASVKVGGRSCVVTANTASSLTCTVPAGEAGEADIVITNSKGSTSVRGGFRYTATTARRPGKPLRVWVKSMNSDGSVTIRWRRPLDDGGAPILRYVVKVRGTYEDHYHRYSRVGASVRTERITGLKPGQRYWFRVRAVNVMGRGPRARTPHRVLIAI